MKLMKKLFILTLMVVTLLLVACANSSGGDTPSSSGDTPSSSDGTGSNSSPDSGGNSDSSGDSVPTYVAPTLPANKGTDPFGAGGTFTGFQEKYVRYEINTSTKTIRRESQSDESYHWISEYTYSYDNTVSSSTITVSLSKESHGNGTLLTIPESINTVETSIKEILSQEYDAIIAESDEQKGKAIADFNKVYGTNLIASDFTEDNKDTTINKIMNSQKVKKEIDEIKKDIIERASVTSTYTVTVDTNDKTVGFTGQYDPNRKWYEQLTGRFYASGTTSNNTTINIWWHNGYIYFNDEEYKIITVTDTALECVNKESSVAKFFPYTREGTATNPIIKVKLDDSTTVECTWRARSLDY